MKPPTSAAPRLEEYQDKFRFFNFERHDGILQVTFHTDGGEMAWGWEPHEEAGYMFRDIGADPDNLVIILTGTGETFIDMSGVKARPVRLSPEFWARAFQNGKRLTRSLLEIEVPVIAAINGPLTMHGELILMSDITLSSDTAVFSEPHLEYGRVPGDGVHVWWPIVLGPNRARYFMLTGQILTAADMLELGVVNEVLAKEDVVPRAWEHARMLLDRPALVRQFVRQVTIVQLQNAMESHLALGLALEGLAAGATDPPA
jgi:enoyl-CoA hydratase/carnithine racemase